MTGTGMAPAAEGELHLGADGGGVDVNIGPLIRLVALRFQSQPVQAQRDVSLTTQ